MGSKVKAPKELEVPLKMHRDDASEVNIYDGNISEAHFGPTSYNVTKDKRQIVKIRHVDTVVVSPTSSSRETTPDGAKSFEDSDWIVINKQFRFNQNRKLAPRSDIFYGQQHSDVTGINQIAIKLLQFGEHHLREARILTELQHPHIVKVFHSDSFVIGSWRKIYMALELCHDKNLFDHTVMEKEENIQFNSHFAITQSKQLAKALRYIHSKKIMHRDLKPHNVLLSLCKNYLKLSDFGMSKLVTSDNAPSMARIGTDGYRAPEVYNKKEITFSSDIFSFGLVLYFIWSNGLHPYGNDPDDWNGNIKRNQNLDLNGLLIQEHSKDAKSLLEKMLNTCAKKRPTAEQLLSYQIFSKPITARSDYSFSSEKETTHEKRRSQTDSTHDSSNCIKRNQNFFNRKEVAPKEFLERGPESLQTTFARSCITRKNSNQTNQAPRPRSFTDISSLPEPIKPEILHCHYDKEFYNHLLVFDMEAGGTRSYNPQTKIWKLRHMIYPEMSQKKFSSVTFNGFIYLIFSDRRLFRLKVSASNSMWEQLPPMKYHHGDHPPAVVLFSKIYVFGSVGGSMPQPCYKVECFDPRLNTWIEFPSLQNRRHNHAILAAQRCICCIGGESGGGLLRSVERFDPESKVWYDIPPMTQNRTLASATFYQLKLFVLGGYCMIGYGKYAKLPSVEVFDIKSRMWTPFTSMLKPRAELSTVIINNEMFSVGGDKEGFSQEKRTIEHYNFSLRKWNIFTVRSGITFDNMAAVAILLEE